MAYSRVGFDLGRIQIHQMLGVRLTGDGGASMPLRPTWEPREQGTNGRVPELATQRISPRRVNGAAQPVSTRFDDATVVRSQQNATVGATDLGG